MSPQIISITGKNICLNIPLRGVTLTARSAIFYLARKRSPMSF